MIRHLLVVSLLVATPALAHLVKIPPSTCALTVSLSAPAAGDLLRVSYEPDASPTRSRVLACPADPVDPAGRCGAIVLRGFTLGASTGTIALPAAFALRMLSTGDLEAAGVPIAITVDGTPATVSFDLTTGFVVAGTIPILGRPIDAGGAFALVGTGTSATLPAPLGGAALRLDLACTLAPAPDLDQFALAPRLTKIRGVFTAKSEKLVMVLESELAMAVDSAGLPTILRLDGPTGTPIVYELVTLHGAPRGRFASADGAVTVSTLGRKTVRAQKIVVRRKIPQGGPPAFLGGDGDLAIASGGLTARRGVTLRTNGRGTRLTARER